MTAPELHGPTAAAGTLDRWAGLLLDARDPDEQRLLGRLLFAAGSLGASAAVRAAAAAGEPGAALETIGLGEDRLLVASLLQSQGEALLVRVDPPRRGALWALVASAVLDSGDADPRVLGLLDTLAAPLPPLKARAASTERLEQLAREGRVMPARTSPVVVRCGPIIRAYEKDGKIAWTQDARQEQQQVVAAMRPDGVLPSDGELVFRMSWDDSVEGLDPETGEARWVAPVSLPSGWHARELLPLHGGGVAGVAAANDGTGRTAVAWMVDGAGMPTPHIGVQASVGRDEPGDPWADPSDSRPARRLLATMQAAPRDGPAARAIAHRILDPARGTVPAGEGGDVYRARGLALVTGAERARRLPDAARGIAGVEGGMALAGLIEGDGELASALAKLDEDLGPKLRVLSTLARADRALKWSIDCEAASGDDWRPACLQLSREAEVLWREVGIPVDTADVASTLVAMSTTVAEAGSPAMASQLRAFISQFNARVMPGRDGAACASRPCAVGHYCAPSGRCAPILEAGASCTPGVDGACGPGGWTCVDGRCVDRSTCVRK